jgi:hypothetical protein
LSKGQRSKQGCKEGGEQRALKSLDEHFFNAKGQQKKQAKGAEEGEEEGEDLLLLFAPLLASLAASLR